MTVNTVLNNRNKMVFIGGAPRSGTTLMQRIMGGHSSVYAGPEFDFIPAHITGLRDQMIKSIRSGRISEIVDEPVLDQAFRAMICTVFEDRLAKSGKTFFSEKTPANALAFKEIGEFFPDARFVMMVRDPRDIANSMKSVRNKFLKQGQRPPRFLRSVAASVEEINKYYETGLAAAQTDDRIMIVYYEDLVDDPEKVVRQVCAHVELAYEPQMVHIEQQKNSLDAPEGDGAWYSKAQLQQPIQKGGVVTTNQLCSPKEVAQVERFTLKNPALDRYRLNPGAPGLWENLNWKISKLAKLGLFLPRHKRT